MKTILVLVPSIATVLYFFAQIVPALTDAIQPVFAALGM